MELNQTEIRIKVVETVFIPQNFFFFPFIFSRPQKLHFTRELWWRGSSRVLYIWTHSSLQTMLVKPCPGIMQNSTDINTPPFHVPETPCMIPKLDRRGKTRNQKANYNSKMNGKKYRVWTEKIRKRWTCSYYELVDARRWRQLKTPTTKKLEDSSTYYHLVKFWREKTYRSHPVSRWLSLPCFGCQG